MNIKVCNCWACRAGRRKKNGFGDYHMRCVTRKGRRLTKAILHDTLYKDEDAWEKLPESISAGYTD